jgi:hypothetical protein
MTQLHHPLFAGDRKPVMGPLRPSAMIGKRLAHGRKGALTVFVKITPAYPVLRADGGRRFSPEQRQNSLHPAFVLRQDVRHGMGH